MRTDKERGGGGSQKRKKKALTCASGLRLTFKGLAGFGLSLDKAFAVSGKTRQIYNGDHYKGNTRDRSKDKGRS